MRPAAALCTAVLACACSSGCRAGAPPTSTVLGQEAYVWQRRWTPSVVQAVRQAPSEIRALRVLAREWPGAGARPVDLVVDLAALEGREVVAVARVEGTGSLEHVRLGELATLARAWQAAGVRVRGVEVDYDCPSSRLGEYAAWLREGRVGLGGLRLEITALPTWWDSGLRADLEEAVDAVTLQVHAVRAPVLFDPAQARLDVLRWARAARRPFTVALPTYRAHVGGAVLTAEPESVAAFARALGDTGARGVVWFRLGHREDREAWSPATLAAVVRGGALRRQVEVRLLAGPPGTQDVQVRNVGDIDADAPERIGFAVPPEFLGGARSYQPFGDRALLSLTPPRVRVGESVVVGFVRGSRGSEVTLAARP